MAADAAIAVGAANAGAGAAAAGPAAVPLEDFERLFKRAAKPLGFGSFGEVADATPTALGEVFIAEQLAGLPESSSARAGGGGGGGGSGGGGVKPLIVKTIVMGVDWIKDENADYEIKALAHVHHQNIVRFFGSWHCPGSAPGYAGRVFSDLPSAEKACDSVCDDARPYLAEVKSSRDGRHFVVPREPTGGMTNDARDKFEHAFEAVGGGQRLDASFLVMEKATGVPDRGEPPPEANGASKGEFWWFCWDKPMSERRAKLIFVQLLLAVDFLHSRQPHPIVHRDLKSENMLVCGYLRGADGRDLLSSEGEPVPVVKLR